MAWTYTITIAGIGTVSASSLTQALKIDESLDSAILVIPRTTRKDIYPRYSEVSISVSDGTDTDASYWVIYSDKVEIAASGSTLRYEHTLGLIEPIKLLEKYSCGSLTFTQPLGGSRYTMYDVVERIRQLTPFKRYSMVSTTRKFTIDSALATYLDGIDAPQFYLDKKNLREALIEVFKYIHAIPRIRFTSIAGEWVLYADFINNWQTNITPNGEDETQLDIIDHTTEADGGDYSTATESFLENAVLNDDETTPSVITEMLTFRNESDIVVGDSNFKIILQSPIYVPVHFEGITEADDGEILTLDLDDYIIEKNVYDTYDVTSGKGSKSCSGYWQKGSNAIDGLNENYGSFSLQIAVENMFEAAILEQHPTKTVFSVSWETCVLRVSYISYIETMRSIQYREDLSLNAKIKDDEAVMQINQSERINNLFNTTNNVYGQTQRLGVDTLSFSKKHRSLHAYDDTHIHGVYSLGDYTAGGYIIVKVEKVYFNSFVIGRYEVSRNFNRIAQFIPISREFRAYEISLVKSDYTLKRDILIPVFYVEAALSSNDDHVSNDLITPFMNTFKNSTYDLSLKGAALQRANESGTYERYGVYMPINACAEKNTLKFRFDFSDTKIAGKRISEQYVAPSTFLKQIATNYTFDDGTIPFIKIKLFTDRWDYKSSVLDSDYKTLLGYTYLARKEPLYDEEQTCALSEDYYAADYDKIHIYDYASEFPGTGVIGDYYIARLTALSEPDNEIKTYSGTYDSLSPTAFMVAEPNDYIHLVGSHKIIKDGAEILGIEMFMPIVPKSSDTNKIVIGDALTKDNVLIKARAVAKTLYYYTSTKRFNKANTATFDSATATKTAITVDTYISTANHRITIPLGLSGNYDYVGIGDSDGNMYLGLNLRGLDGTKANEPVYVYFNFLYER